MTDLLPNRNQAGRRFGAALRLGFATLALAASAWGSAFSVNENGVRAQGMGGAFVSVADDASALFFNPAGLARLKGTQLEMDSLVVVGLFRFFPSSTPPGTVVPSNGYSGSIKPHFIPIAALYATKQLNENWGIGFAGFAPFGLAANFTNFNDGDPAHTKFVGRFAGTRAALKSFWFQPTIARKLGKYGSIGGGPALVHTHLFLEQSILNPYDKPTDFGRSLARDVFPGVDPNLAWSSFTRILPEGRLRAAATSKAIGFNVGYLYKNPDKKMNFGIAWRSAVVHHLKGEASFAFTNTGAIKPFLPVDRTLEIQFPNQKIAGLLVTPANYQIGASTSRFFGTLISVDYNLQDYRRFQTLPINFSVTTDAKGKPIGTSPELRLNFNFENAWAIHFGAERKFGKDMHIRAGYMFDHSPVPDKSTGPLFPDSSRNSYTVGATKDRGNLELSVFYQAMFFVNRVTNVPDNNFQFTNGEYRNFAHLAGLGMRMFVGGRK